MLFSSCKSICEQPGYEDSLSIADIRNPYNLKPQEDVGYDRKTNSTFLGHLHKLRQTHPAWQ
jgi:hypothetical protein